MKIVFLEEIIFVSCMWRRGVTQPPMLPEIAGVASQKILGVTLASGPTASSHVRDVVSNCAQTSYELRVVRAHSMCNGVL